MAATSSRLSYELVEMIFKLLSKRSLASASLVCRTWHTVASPLLYHTVILTKGKVVSHFANRVLGQERQSGKGKGLLRAASCIHRLNLRLHLSEQWLIVLGEAISKLINLEYLEWDTTLLGDLDWHSTLVLLHESLPSLRSLKLVLSGGEFQLGDSSKVIALTNLRELAVDFIGQGNDEELSDVDHELLHEYAGDVPTVASDLICGASNLESLSLRFHPNDYPLGSTLNWCPLDITAALSHRYLSNLHTLRIHAGTESVPYGGDSLGNFLRKHHQLHTVVLDTSNDFDPNHPYYLTGPTPDEIEISELLPSVRHFEGPCVMIEALLKSKLAAQIETLTLTETYNGGLGTFDKLLPKLPGFKTPLSCLKVLEIVTDTVGWSEILAGLIGFAGMMPELVRLTVDGTCISGRTPSVWDKYLEKLEPNLCTLAIPMLPTEPPERLGIEVNDDKPFILLAGTLCSRLEYVDNVSDQRLVGWWKIIRKEGLLVDAVYMRNPDFFEPVYILV